MLDKRDEKKYNIKLQGFFEMEKMSCKNQKIRKLCVKGGYFNEKNLSAQEASEKERTRLYEENVYKKRTQGACTQESKG